MTNVKVALDEETLGWVRLESARRQMSVSSIVRELLREHMHRRDERRFLFQPAYPLNETRSPLSEP